MYDALAVVSDIEVMGDHDQGNALLTMQGGEDGDYLITGVAIQVAGRLVCQNKGWVFHQSPGNGEPLLLSPGKLGGAVMGPVGEANLS